MSRVMSCVVLITMFLMIGCEGVPIVGVAESAVVGASVTTDANIYQPGQGIVVTWSGLPGSDHDWVAYAPAGSPNTVVTRWSYSGGRTLGAAAFQGIWTPGLYVARAFLDDSYIRSAESAPFLIGAPGPSRTIVVPVVGPASDGPRIQLYGVVSGLGSAAHPLIVPLQLEIGSIIRGFRARVQDGGTGTQIQMKVVSTTDGAEAFSTIATAPLSSGSGTEETMSITDLSITAAAATQYLITFFDASGGAASNIYRLEVDLD